MSTAINIIPTLDSQSILTDPRDILGYIVRYYCTAPKTVSDTTSSYMISIADTISRYQAAPSNMIKQVTNDLQGILNRFFPVNASSVDVTSSTNPDGSYNLTIRLTAVSNGTSYSLGSDVTVNSAGILNLKWHPQLI